MFQSSESFPYNILHCITVYRKYFSKAASGRQQCVHTYCTMAFLKVRFIRHSNTPNWRTILFVIHILLRFVFQHNSQKKVFLFKKKNTQSILLSKTKTSLWRIQRNVWDKNFIDVINMESDSWSTGKVCPTIDSIKS